MKHTFLLLFAALTLSVVSREMSAQNDNRTGVQRQGGQRGNFDPAAYAQHRTEQMVRELELNAQQAEALKALNDTVLTKMRPNRSANNQRPNPQTMSEEERREFFKQMQQERQKQQEAYKAELKKILTPEQFVKYEELEKQRAQRNPRGGQRPGGQRGQ